MRSIPVSYLVAAGPSISLHRLLTVPDAPDGNYSFAGVPDGLGVIALNENLFDLVCTHEIFYNEGAERAHARSGAFVSRWRIDKRRWASERLLEVIKGWDQIDRVYYWRHNRTPPSYGSNKNVPLERLCSADLPPVSALYYHDDNAEYGARERIFLGGEETHTKYKLGFGRAWAHILTGAFEGETYELPHMGRISFENVVCCPHSQVKTIAIGLDDATDKIETEFKLRSPPSELYVYVGEKSRSGDHEKGEDLLKTTGLFGGTLYGLQVQVECMPLRGENETNGFSQDQPLKQARFALVSLGDRSIDDPLDNPGTALQKESIKKQVTQFLRIEDGAWDPRIGHQHQFYFVTTHRFDGNSRLFRITFDDITKPESGGIIEILLDGIENGVRRYQMLDSITVDPWGRVFLQEDTGGKDYVTRTLMYLPDSGGLYEVARGNEHVFRDSSHPSFLTIDEESAGIIPAFDILGEGWFLTAVQAHRPVEGWVDRVCATNLAPDISARMADDLVEPGQILAIQVPQGVEIELPEV